MKWYIFLRNLWQGLPWYERWGMEECPSYLPQTLTHLVKVWCIMIFWRVPWCVFCDKMCIWGGVGRMSHGPQHWKNNWNTVERTVGTSVSMWHLTRTNDLTGSVRMVRDVRKPIIFRVRKNAHNAWTTNKKKMHLCIHWACRYRWPTQRGCRQCWLWMFSRRRHTLWTRSDCLFVVTKYKNGNYPVQKYDYFQPRFFFYFFDSWLWYNTIEELLMFYYEQLIKWALKRIHISWLSCHVSPDVNWRQPDVR